MIRSVRLLAAFLTFHVSIAVCGDLPDATPEELGLSSKRVQTIADYVDSLVTTGDVPGAVAIVTYQGKVILHKASGLAERDPRNEMKLDTVFRIASMTKPITSVAVMILVDEGKVKLDDPVTKFIPSFAPQVLAFNGPRPAREEIKIKHLLSHTSGLAYNNAPSIGELYTRENIQSGVCRSTTTLDQNIQRLARIPLLFDPGEQFNYGMSTDVLGLVVEKASGKSLGEFFDEKIFKPLGMSDTSFRVPMDKRQRLAGTFVAEDNGLRQLGPSEQITQAVFNVVMSPDYPIAEDHRYISGGGGLCGTTMDYARFCQMILGNGSCDGVQILRPETVNLMTTNQIGSLESSVAGDLEYKFGLGFSVFPSGPVLRNEVGWGGVWGTVFRISRGGNWAAVLLTQRIFDESYIRREIEFTRTVREAIQEKLAD
jgi:CubicO group peptidase (beta-lactamase class C family)